MADRGSLESDAKQASGRPAGALADRRPAPRPCPDVPDRLAGGPESTAGGSCCGSRTWTRRRVRPEATRGALVDLSWLGLDWDEGPGRRRSVGTLRPVRATRRSIDGGPGTPQGGGDGLSLHLHPGRHRARGQRPAPGGRGTDLSRHLRTSIRRRGRCVSGDRPFAWRFRVPPGPIAWDDLFQGRVAIDPARVGRRLHRRAGTRSVPPISSRSSWTTPRWASTR